MRTSPQSVCRPRRADIPACFSRERVWTDRNVCPAANASHRTGFTLIEVLAVLAISGMIVIAAFGAIHTQTRLQTTGQSQVERSLIRRGVFDDLSSDLRAVVRPTLEASPPPKTGPQRETLWQGATPLPTTDFSERVLEFSPRSSSTVVGFYGDADRLVIELSAPSSRFPAETSSTAGSTLPSGSQQILWYCHSGRALRVPTSRHRDSLQYTAVNAAEWPRGLTRITFPALSALTAKTLTPQTAVWDSIDTEIETIGFRYFDGHTWHSSWDGHARKELPHAVEVQLTSASSETQSFLIRLPQGE